MTMLRLALLLMSLHGATADLATCVRFWQREMGLEDWHISVEVVHRSQLSDWTVGNIDADPPTRTAIIRVLDVADLHLPLRQARADQRLTIAHEMVHLKRLVRDRSPLWQEESATDEQTLALLRKYRRSVELSVVEQ